MELKPSHGQQLVVGRLTNHRGHGGRGVELPGVLVPPVQGRLFSCDLVSFNV